MKISLEIKTNLEGIAVLKTGGIEHGFMIVLKCCNCGELSGEVTVSADEKESLNHSRGDTNLNIRCKFCSRENSLDIIPESFGNYNAI